MKHDVFMQKALNEAQQSLDQKLLPVGAVLVIDNEVVAKAHKDETTSYHLDHAETLLVREYFKGKKVYRGDIDITLYTTLEPCMMCLGVILHLPINRLVYAAKDPYGGGCCIMDHRENLPIRHQNNIEIIGGICEDEAKEQLREFLKITEQSFYKDTENPLVHYILN